MSDHSKIPPVPQQKKEVADMNKLIKLSRYCPKCGELVSEKTDLLTSKT